MQVPGGGLPIVLGPDGPVTGGYPRIATIIGADLYLLGRAAETQGNAADAVTYYQRVFVLDIQFRDTADRLNELEKVTR